MSLASYIRRGLESEFAFAFNVSELEDSQHLRVAIQAEGDILFDVFVTIKNDIRLKIKVEPQTNGGYLMNLIYKSSSYDREKFVKCWSRLENAKTLLKINERPLSKQEFLDFSNFPNKFSFEFSIVPYCDDDECEQSRHDTVLNYVVIIFKMLLSIVPYNIVGLEEGDSFYQISKRYERNPANRHICLKLKGTRCSVCDFDFEEKYGSLGQGYIEIHHSLPVSKMKPGHVVKPNEELFPVCANCHRMLHRKSPPYSIEELREIVNIERNKK